MAPGRREAHPSLLTPSCPSQPPHPILPLLHLQPPLQRKAIADLPNQVSRVPKNIHQAGLPVTPHLGPQHEPAILA